jgi:hypothetical protein
MHPSDKLLGDLIRQNPKEVTVIVLGPLTVLARAMDRLVQTPSEVADLSAAARGWAESISWEALLPRYEALIEQTARVGARAILDVRILQQNVMRARKQPPQQSGFASAARTRQDHRRKASGGWHPAGANSFEA